MAAPSYSTPAFGRNVHLFQPPQQSPIASTTTSTSTDYFSTQSRKRQRPDSSHSYENPQQTPWTGAATPSWVQCPTPSDGVYYSSAGMHGDGGVNERYRLRDGFDTPGLLATSDSHHGEQLDFRTKCRDIAPPLQQDAAGAPTQGPLARERNGAPRLLPSSPNGQTHNWASFAFTLVSKAFSFGSGMIRGFYAGEGQGYDFGPSGHVRSPSRGWIRPRSSGDGSLTPVPGSWRDDDGDGYFEGDFEQDNPHSPTTTKMEVERPGNKRRQTDKDTWVMVGTTTTPDYGVDPGSPKRKSTPGSSIPRPNSRPSASRASSRRSLAPVSRRQQSAYITHTGSPATTTAQYPYLEQPSRRASLAPVRSRPSTATSVPSPTAYVSPDAERFVKRRAKHDRLADKTMSSMSRQLEDLIRQGQQALGTKFSVEGHDEDMETDEGFVDEEW